MWKCDVYIKHCRFVYNDQLFKKRQTDSQGELFKPIYRSALEKEGLPVFVHDIVLDYTHLFTCCI